MGQAPSFMRGVGLVEKKSASRTAARLSAEGGDRPCAVNRQQRSWIPIVYFLSSERRQALITSLVDLTMPHRIAQSVASYGDNLQKLDGILASHIRKMIDDSHALRQARINRNEEWRRECEIFLEADLLVFKSYTQEICSRRLPSLLFPMTTRMISGAIGEAIDRSRAMTRHALAHRGLLQ